jgi:integrase
MANGGRMKKITRKWSGQLGELMEKHLELRRSLGAIYVANEITLHSFHRYLNRHYPGSATIKREMVKRYIDSRVELKPWGRRNVLISIRQFCRFMSQRGKCCYIPDKTLIPKLSYRVRYYPLSKTDVKAIINAANRNSHLRPIVRMTYVTMIGIAWCAGLRRSEVAKLNHGDVDLERNTLFIRETKFRKSRLVPIKNSTARALKSYIEEKKKNGYESIYRDALFMNRQGKRMSTSSLNHTFKRLTLRAGIKTLNKATHQRPSLHDLRHSFATRNLNRFYNESARLPPQAYLPVLATYLGHASMVYTQYYLHPEFDLLVKASEKLEKSKRAVKK